ncbi:MAG: hypothetical protein IPM52_08040 [Bacteroidetes bacterium]|nr:hypothetical protein [Bacteroidota bacterium]
MSERFIPIARLISYFLHPLLIPSYAYMIALSINGHERLQIPANLQWSTGGIVLLLTALVPSIIFYIMLRMEMVSSLQMPHRQERNVPILVTALLFYLTYQLLSFLGIAPLFGLYMLAASMLSLLALGFNYWMKISLHMVALGALTGSMAVFTKIVDEHYLSATLAATIAAGSAGTSRLLLGAHRPIEVYLGFVLGFVWMFLLFALVS